MPGLYRSLLLVARYRRPLLDPADPGWLYPLPVLPGHGRGMSRLPVPDWTRPGETWRVETERGGWIASSVAHGGVCSVRGCWRPSVVMRPARTYRGDDYLLCAEHVKKHRMWIEDARLVSWCLRP